MATKQEQVPDEAPGTAGLVLEMASRRSVMCQPSEPAVAPVQGEVVVHANRWGWSRATCGWTRSTDCGRTATAGRRGSHQGERHGGHRGHAHRGGTGHGCDQPRARRWPGEGAVDQ
jgi:hypothetical protein